jgi:Tol biopolymer transport system component
MRSTHIAVAVVVAFAATAHAAHATIRGPEGRIAYSSFDALTGDAHIVIAGPDGRGARELPLPFTGFRPVWSPDGRRLLVSVFGPDGLQPATVAPDGSDFRLLRIPDVRPGTDVTCLAWSPDGARLACTLVNFAGDSSGDGVYTVRSADGGEPERLTTNPFPPQGDFGGGDVVGSYSPDGTRIVFMRARPPLAPGAAQTGALFVVRTDGRALRQITPYGLPNSHDEAHTDWAPDGTRIVFATQGGALFVVHPDGTALGRIPLPAPHTRDFVLAPSWSPNGEHLVFTLLGSQSGQADLFTALANGSSLRAVTDSADLEDWPNWGPA